MDAGFFYEMVFLVLTINITLNTLGFEIDQSLNLCHGGTE